MRKTTRMVVLGIVSACALTISSTAFAAFTSPRLFASQPDQKNRIDLLYTQSTADDNVAKVAHYVPVPYRLNLSAKPSGTQVGSAVLRTNLASRSNQNFVLSGVIEVGTAATTFTRGGTSSTLGAAALACTGSATQTAYWVARLRDAGGDVTYDLPIFVNRLAAATAFEADATITTCFQNPAAAPLGMKVREFNLGLVRVLTTPAKGDIRWSTLATPYSAAGAVNNAGTVEVQSIVQYPRAVSLRAPVRVKLTSGFATFKFDGSVTVPVVDNPRVSLFRGATKVQAGSRSASAYTIKRGAGNFTKLHTIKRNRTTAQTFYFQVRAFVPNQIQGKAGCVTNFHPNVECINATRAGYMVRSRTVMVRVPQA